MRIAYVLLTASLSQTPIAFAQAKAKKAVEATISTEEQREVLRGMAIAHVRGILGKFLQEHQYSVEINFDLAANAMTGLDVPYAPASIVADAYQSVPAAEAMARLTNVKVTLILPDYIDQATQETLKTLVQSGLQSEKGPKVQVEARQVKLNVKDPNKANNAPPAPSAAPAQAVQAAAAANAHSEKIIQAALDQVKNLESEIEKLKKIKSTPPAEVSDTKSGRANNWQEFLEFAKSNPVLVGVAVLLSYLGAFVILLIPFRLIAGALRGFGDAFSAIAKAIKSFSDSFSNRSNSGGEDAGKTAAGSSQVQASIVGGAENHMSSNRAIDPQKVRERIEGLRRGYTSDADSLALEYVTSLINDPEKRSSAPIFLEILDSQTARQIFQRLNEKQKQALVTALKTARTSDKGQLIMDLIDAFETKLAGKDWKGLTDVHLNPEIKSQVLALGAEDLLLIASDLSEEGLRRLLLYLTPESVVMLLQSGQFKNQSGASMVDLIASMPQALMLQGADKELAQKLNAQFLAKSSDHYQYYLSNFVQIIENAGEGVDDQLLEALAEARPEIGSNLRKQITTLGIFFRLSEAKRSEVLQAFTNSEVAALLSAFPDEKKREAIVNCIDKRRRDLVDESVDLLKNESRSVISEGQKRSKARLLQALRQMGEAGELAEDAPTPQLVRAVGKSNQAA